MMILAAAPVDNLFKHKALMQCGNYYCSPSSNGHYKDYIEQNYFLQNSPVQINSKLNEKNVTMITYTNHMTRTELSNLKQEKKLLS